MSLTPAEQMVYSATRISTFKNGQPLSVGTGFFYMVRLDDERYTVILVTNKHVLEGCEGIELKLPLKDDDGLPSANMHTWTLEFIGDPILHPDSNIDLAAISVTNLHALDANGKKRFPFYVAFEKSAIPTKDIWESFDSIEEVTMIGCPNGLYDSVNNSPIVRKGITATAPSRNYEGRPEFMIDLACFPGSSGSPVFLYSTGAVYDKASGGFILGNIRLFLLGVLYAGPTVDQSGHIVMNKIPSVSVKSMMHLGMVVKADQLLIFDEMVKKQVGQA